MGTGGISTGEPTSAGPDRAASPPGGPPAGTAHGVPLRLTRRGRRVLLGAVLLVVVVAAAAGAARVGGPACEVSTADGGQDLDLADAQRLTSAALATTPPAALSASDRAVVTALGTRDGALSCRLSADERRSRADLAREAETRTGLTPRATRVRKALRAAAGKLPLGGFAPGGVTTGHMPGSAHYEGRAVDVFFRPVSPENSRHGWLVAQWLVAHADRLDVDTVIFDDRIWTASRSSSGWRPYVPAQGPTRNAVLRHLDHVHVDVARGT